MKTISPADAEMVKAYLHLIEAGLDASGNIISLNFRGNPITYSYTLATMPDASSVAVGTIINIPRSEFTTSTAQTVPGMPEDGIYLKATDGVWKPAWFQLFASEKGSKASPLETYSTSAASKVRATLPSGEPIIPWEIHGFVGFKTRMIIEWGTTGTVGAGVQMFGYLGSQGTYTNNPVIAWGSQIASGATNRQVCVDNYGRVQSYASAASNVFTLERLPHNTTGTITSDDGISDTNNKLDFAADAQMQIAWSPGAAATTGALYGYELWIG